MNEPTQSTPEQALAEVEKLRLTVLTVFTPYGPTALAGAQHDTLRIATQILAEALVQLDALKQQVVELTAKLAAKPAV